MSSAVTKKGDQQVAQPGSGQAVMESKEQNASASANVRINPGYFMLSLRVVEHFSEAEKVEQMLTMFSGRR